MSSDHWLITIFPGVRLRLLAGKFMPAARSLTLPITLLAMLTTVASAQGNNKRVKTQVGPAELPQIQLAQTGKIDFPEKLVPPVQGALPLIRLYAQKVPLNFMHETLGKLGIQAERIQPLSRLPQLSTQQRPAPEEFKGVMESERMRAYWQEQ